MAENLQISSIVLNQFQPLHFRGQVFPAEGQWKISWNTKNAVFCFETSCGLLFVGKTKQSLQNRFKTMRSEMKKGKQNALFEHLSSNCPDCLGKHTLYVLRSGLLASKELNSVERHFMEVLQTKKDGLNVKEESSARRRKRHAERKATDPDYVRRRSEVEKRSYEKRKSKPTTHAEKEEMKEKKRQQHKIRMADAVKRRALKTYKSKQYKKSRSTFAGKLKYQRNARRRYRKRHPIVIIEAPEITKKRRNHRRKVKRHLFKHGFCTCTLNV